MKIVEIQDLLSKGWFRLSLDSVRWIRDTSGRRRNRGNSVSGGGDGFHGVVVYLCFFTNDACNDNMRLNAYLTRTDRDGL